MTYSRSNPSPRYRELLDLYRAMHQEGEKFLGIGPQDTFPGKSLLPQVHRIKALVQNTGAQTLLDYGSGKGTQYGAWPLKDPNGNEFPGVLDYWDIEELTCYDPCYAPYAKYPQGKFDGVISTDVLEHCPEEDLRWIIEEIFGFASRFVFATVASYPARKRLPSGENAHCTIRPSPWWGELVGEVSAKHPGVDWEFWIQSVVDTPDGGQRIDERIGSFKSPGA